MRFRNEAVPGLKIQYFKGDKRVGASHCYVLVACEGMADELCKTAHSCRARLSPAALTLRPPQIHLLKTEPMPHFTGAEREEELGILFSSS